MAVGTKPEFQMIPEAAVLAELEDTNSQHPIAVEVGRLVALYTADLRQKPLTVENQPSLETHYPIEAVALRLATKLAGVPVVKGSHN